METARSAPSCAPSCGPAGRAALHVIPDDGALLAPGAQVMDLQPARAKARAQRGRAQLREIADEPEATRAQLPHTPFIGMPTRAPSAPICRPFQRARFRRDPRHELGRFQARSRPANPATRQGRCPRYFRPLFHVNDCALLGPGAWWRASPSWFRSYAAWGPGRNTSAAGLGVLARSRPSGSAS